MLHIRKHLHAYDEVYFFGPPLDHNPYCALLNRGNKKTAQVPCLCISGNTNVAGKIFKVKNLHYRDFPGGSVVKNLPANAVDTGSIPGPGRSHMLRSN